MRTVLEFLPARHSAGVIKATVGSSATKGLSEGHEERPTSMLTITLPAFPIRCAKKEFLFILCPFFHRMYHVQLLLLQFDFPK